jgi:hypothetical protein
MAKITNESVGVSFKMPRRKSSRCEVVVIKISI